MEAACYWLAHIVIQKLKEYEGFQHVPEVRWTYQAQDRAVFSPTSAASNLTHRRLYSKDSHVGTSLLHFHLMNQLPDESSTSRITSGQEATRMPVRDTNASEAAMNFFV